jgi:hypothetical protein
MQRGILMINIKNLNSLYMDYILLNRNILFIGKEIYIYIYINLWSK